MQPPIAETADADAQPSIDLGGALDRRGFAWAVFEWARNPYYFLIVIYVFPVYFGSLIGQNLIASGALSGLDPEAMQQAANAKGQEAIASVVKTAGVVAALTAPFLGAALDKGGRRKPLLAVFLGTIAAMSALLWFTKPDGSGLSTSQTMAALVIAYVAYTYSEVTHNSMLNINGRRSALPAISGLGLALGALASSLLMAFIVLAFAMPALVQWPFPTPLFGLDVEAGEHFRLAGPICSVWLALFSVHFFLRAEDGGTPGASWSKAIKLGAQSLHNTFRRAGENINILKFLGARMLYADAMAALLALVGIYIGLYLEWNIVELAAYAILSSVFGFGGGVLGGWLDSRVGPKRALMIEISGMIVTFVFQLSVTPASIFYGAVESYSIWNGPVFTTLSDVAFLTSAIFISITATASISSSRTMLVHLAPAERVGEFFGLYAIAGTVTVWLGPLLVELVTGWTGDQRIGMTPIGVLFLLGLAVLSTVESGKHPATGA